MKIEEILESDLTWKEKFEKAKEIFEKQMQWLNSEERTTEEKVKYYNKFQETLEAVRHLYCMYMVGYDPNEDVIKDFNKYIGEDNGE